MLLLHKHSPLRCCGPSSQRLSPEHPQPTQLPLRFDVEIRSRQANTGHSPTLLTPSVLQLGVLKGFPVTADVSSILLAAQGKASDVIFYEPLCLTPHISSNNKFSRVHSQNPNSHQFPQPVLLTPWWASSGMGPGYRVLQNSFLSPAFARLLTHLSTGSRMSLSWGTSGDNSLLVRTLHCLPISDSSYCRSKGSQVFYANSP